MAFIGANHVMVSGTFFSKTASTSLVMMNEVRKAHELHINERKHLERHLISFVVSFSDSLCEVSCYSSFS